MPVLAARVGKERLLRPRRSRATSAAGSGTPPRGRASARSTQPELDYELPASDDEDWRFTATVAVQPKPELPDWTQLEVRDAEAEVPRGARRRRSSTSSAATVAELAPVEGRPAQAGRHRRPRPRRRAGEAQRDYVVELGGGRLVEELEQGARRHERRRDEGDPVRARATTRASSVDVTRQGDQGEGAAAARRRARALRLRVRHARRAARRHRGRLREQLEDEIEAQFRGAVADALVEASNVEPGRAARRGAHPRAAERARPLGRAPRRPARHVPRDDGHRSRGARGAHARGGARSRSRASSCSRPRPTSSASRSRTSEVEELVREQAEAADEDVDAVARGASPHGRLRAPARGPAPARRARPARRRGEADPDRARRGARGDLDAGQGKAPDRDETVDPRSKES